jgi:hypothetical protein
MSRGKVPKSPTPRRVDLCVKEHVCYENPTQAQALTLTPPPIMGCTPIGHPAADTVSLFTRLEATDHQQ